MKYILLMTVIGLLAQVGFFMQLSLAQQSNSALKIASNTDTDQVLRTYDLAQIARGRNLYRKNCAECHGKNAEGAPNWRQKNPNGKYPPPPLNGTGHAWHHPMNALRMTIRDGTQKIGGNMPAWGGKLSEQEIDDIITWFQSEWPDEIWQAWYRHNKKFTNR